MTCFCDQFTLKYDGCQCKKQESPLVPSETIWIDMWHPEDAILDEISNLNRPAWDLYALADTAYIKSKTLSFADWKRAQEAKYDLFLR